MAPEPFSVLASIAIALNFYFISDLFHPFVEILIIQALGRNTYGQASFLVCISK